VDTQLNIESQRIYKEIREHLDTFKDPRPRPGPDFEIFKLLSKLTHLHFSKGEARLVSDLVNCAVRFVDKSGHCEGYNHLYKDLVKEIIQTEFLKLFKTIILDVDDLLFYKTINELKTAENSQTFLFSSYKDVPSRFLEPLLTVDILLMVKREGEHLNLSTSWSASWFEKAAEYLIKDRIKYHKKKLKI